MRTKLTLAALCLALVAIVGAPVTATNPDPATAADFTPATSFGGGCHICWIEYINDCTLPPATCAEAAVEYCAEQGCPR